MKIADVRTVVVGNPWKNWIFVVVETDEGMVGVGEAAGGSETQPRDLSQALPVGVHQGHSGHGGYRDGVLGHSG